MNRQTILHRARPGSSNRLLILAYHGVDEDRPGISSAGSGHVECGEFTWQMEQVAARFKPIVLARLTGHLGGKKPLTGPQVCVSFHTHSHNHFPLALPVLRWLKIDTTWFVPFEGIRTDEASGHVTGLDWTAIRELSSEGADIAHRVVADPGLPVASSAQRRAQLCALRNRVEKQVDTRVHAIGLPGDVRERDKALIYDAAIAGFNLGVEMSAGVNDLRSLSPMMLKSQTVSRDLTRTQFCSLLDALERGE